MKTIKINSLLTMLFLFSSISIFAQQKQNLSVLYVGYDPAIPVSETIINSPTGSGGMSPERFREDVKTRFGEFDTYLKKYFTKVKTVDARSYKAEMSADYDVTIFDQTITPWKERFQGMVDGKMKYEAPKFLTEDFDHATIFIGHTSPVMGESVGTKLDWLCLCLDADAHHLKSEHAIFNGPFQVNLTMVEKPTPEGIKHYPSGKNVPDQIPMWRVQTEGYLDGNGYRVGMVSRGDGFLDSPDAEYISSGVNTKDVGAVAIGRHGNFFLWGFSASPNYMTDEAKLVFANAVVYMKQFKGKKPIARKYNNRIATRTYVDDMIARLNNESFEDYKDYIAEINVQMANTVKELKAKKDNGEVMTEMEEMIMKAQSQPQPIPNWEEYIAQTSREFFKPEYTENITALKKFLKENRKYMYSGTDDSYSLKIDEEAKHLGLGNDDIALLEKSVSLLKKGEQTDLANTILNRYTGMQKSVTDWEKWLKQNKSKLFFTESGGYKWMVDTTK